MMLRTLTYTCYTILTVKPYVYACEHNDCHPVQVYHALPKCFMEIVIGKQTLTPDNFYVLPY